MVTLLSGFRIYALDKMEEIARIYLTFFQTEKKDFSKFFTRKKIFFK